jgi:hypothetical protein
MPIPGSGDAMSHCACRSAAIGVGVISLVAPAQSLEKRAEPFDDDLDRSWSSGDMVTYAYYNTCTGWIWTWDADSDFVHRFGTVFEEPPSSSAHTGTMEVYATDAADCPTGSALAAHPLLPRAGWNDVWWELLSVPSRFVIVYSTSGNMDSGHGLEGVNTDHPAAGPTGPQACGSCYPLTRSTHSLYYGTNASALCPGSPLYDGVCNAELLWEAVVMPSAPTSSGQNLDPLSWARIKGLFR